MLSLIVYNTFGITYTKSYTTYIVSTCIEPVRSVIITLLCLTYAKFKIGNRGNTMRKQEKHQRKLQKHQKKLVETPGKTVGNRKSGKYNTERITMIITGIQVAETKQQNISRENISMININQVFHTSANLPNYYYFYYYYYHYYYHFILVW